MTPLNIINLGVSIHTSTSLIIWSLTLHLAWHSSSPQCSLRNSFLYKLCSVRINLGTLSLTFAQLIRHYAVTETWSSLSIATIEVIPVGYFL